MGPHLVLIFLERSFFTIIMLFVLESSKQDFVFERTVYIKKNKRKNTNETLQSAAVHATWAELCQRQNISEPEISKPE